MKNYFLNPDENRLRAGWRILLFIAIAMGLSVLVTNLVKLMLGGLPENATAKIAVRGVIVAVIAPLAAWITRKFIDKKSLKSLGLNFNSLGIKDFLLGFFLSAVMVGVIFLILLYAGMLEVQHLGWSGSNFAPMAGILLWLFGIGLAVGWSEEIVFRGYILQNLKEGMGMTWAIILSCLFYGLVHMSNPNSSVLSGLLIAVIGYLRIFGWLRTGQLWLSMGMHAGWNFCQGPVFGFHVSGVEIEKLIQHNVRGPEWITGGSFGPEAGIIVVPAVLLGLVVMFLWTAKRENTPWIWGKSKGAQSRL